MRRLPQPQKNSSVRRLHDRRAVRLQIILLAGGLLLTGGFVGAVGQHFAAVQYGYQSETLRRERDRLLGEQQQLQLALDRAAAPATLDRAARAIGMQPAQVAQMNGAARFAPARTVRPNNAAPGAATVGARRP